MRMARVAVLMHEQSAQQHWAYGLNVFGAYAGEILRHYGIPFATVADPAALAAGGYDIVVVAHAGNDPQTSELLWKYAEAGGVLVSYAGLRGLAGKLQCAEAAETGSGYAALLPCLEEEPPLRYLRAVPWTPAGAGSGSPKRFGALHDRKPGGAIAAEALLRFAVGDGSVERWAVDIPYTIVGLQQGIRPILEDGIPAPDGSAQVDDGILKADDSSELDWEYDRLTTETGMPYFAYPYADLWKEALAGHLVRCAYSRGLALPFVGFWPEGVAKVATVSHDSDTNEDEQAETTLRVLAECGIRSTWCMIEPGYSPAIYDKVKQAGHELAFHYNAYIRQGGKWGGDEFDRQLAVMKKAMALERVVTNKNHYTRMEGWNELYEWCDNNGIEMDQTRGPSKRGNVGFLFGTCHAFVPIAWHTARNRTFRVLELPFFSQDMGTGAWADESIANPVLTGVERVEGVAHILFHQYHLHYNDHVRQLFCQYIETVKSRGFTFWTAAEINDWTRARRSASVTDIDEHGEAAVSGGGGAIRDLVVWVPAADRQGADIELKLGVPCRKQVCSIAAAALC
ncbi:MAG: hypothetical protein J7639_21475 [Paenibacillaceae bacterium]|nr:hypothetical protein [Paenibacillaceae bacterium]